MKQIDPNHYFGISKNIEYNDDSLNFNFFKKSIIYLTQWYMKKITKRFLDFQYTDKPIAAPKPCTNKTYLLYLHIPFCKTLCPYCSFHKFKFKEKIAKKYFFSLRKEMDLAKKNGFNFASLYIGGGTTTILPEELVETIQYAKTLFDIKEVTCEADPMIDDSLVELLSPHINRISIGLQTTDDEILKKIKRYKKFGSAKEQLTNISKAIGKFPIVNVDLIFNLPNQSKEQLLQDLQMVTTLSPDQVSYYPLMYSPSVKKSIEKNLGKLHNTHEVDFYKTIVSSLKDKYNQLSSWTFAKKDVTTFDEYVVEYNEYIGLGSGSFSFIEDTLYINTFSLKKYEEKITQNQFSIERYKKYSLTDILKYQLMLDFF